MSVPQVAVLATCDTKREEAEYLVSALVARGLKVAIISTAMKKPEGAPSPEQKIRLMRESANNASRKLNALVQSGLAGVIGLGGGTGTWVCIRAMEKLPFGWPKVIVSTLAYDVRPSIAASDIILMPSVADIQGLNPTLRRVLENAAAVMKGLAKPGRAIENTGKPIVGITALGVTNAAVRGISDRLRAAGYEVTAFHATGMGGRAFERWISDGKLDAVIDLTTQELHGLSFGAPIVCDTDRLQNAASTGVPQVVVPGGLDFIARAGLETLSPDEKLRPRFCHSPEYTHIRATKEQVVTTTRLMADRLNLARGPVAVVVPMGGFSAEGSRPDGPMRDPELCRVFAATLQRHLNSDIPVLMSPEAIVSPRFHDRVLGTFFNLVNQSESSRS